jgi:hypothetical protein
LVGIGFIDEKNNEVSFEAAMLLAFHSLDLGSQLGILSSAESLVCMRVPDDLDAYLASSSSGTTS